MSRPIQLTLPMKPQQDPSPLSQHDTRQIVQCMLALLLQVALLDQASQHASQEARDES